jgi:hypothetical protein
MTACEICTVHEQLVFSFTNMITDLISELIWWLLESDDISTVALVTLETTNTHTSFQTWVQILLYYANDWVVCVLIILGIS